MIDRNTEIRLEKMGGFTRGSHGHGWLLFGPGELISALSIRSPSDRVGSQVERKPFRLKSPELPAFDLPVFDLPVFELSVFELTACAHGL